MENEDALKLFESFLYEAPGDDPAPDVTPGGAGPPQVADDDPNAPPDMGPDVGADPADMGDPNAPPEMGGDEGGMFDGGDDMGNDSMMGDDPSQQPENIDLDEKVSAIMNMQLYQRFLSILNNIGSELTMCKINNDMLYTLSPKSLDLVPSLKKLDENIRLYLKNAFIHENYSKNLLFFNKCLNLLRLLNDVFDKDIHKGISELK